MKILKRIAALAAALLFAVAAALPASAAYSEATVTAEALYSSPSYTVAQPRANPNSGTYTENLYVKLTCITSGARIFYTTDGTTPTVYSDEYITPIRIKGKKGESVTTVIRAIAVKTGYKTSDVSEYVYNIQIPIEPDVKYMEIKNKPNKTKYKKGDDLNLTGGKIIVSYDDGTYATIEMTESMISGFNTNTAGEKEITVTYKGFTDTFTINVTGSSSGSSGGYDDDYYSETEEDLRPKLSGTTTQGWSSITKTLAENPTGSSVVIMLNGAASVPSDLIRIAAKNQLVLTFIVNDEMKWTLYTSLIDTETVPSIGLGIRTSAISIMELPIKDIGGTEALRLHINSNNKLNAKLSLDCGAENYYKIASLFLYNSENGTMKLIDTNTTDLSGKADFTPTESGDYIVIIDDETKIKGDLDNDMIIDTFDAAMLMQLIINHADTTDKCDFDNNGTVNALDISAMIKYIVMQ